MTDALFTPVALGAMGLTHRVVHAPMTRLRAEPDDSPSDMMIEYYRQRATPGGLLITESIHPALESRGYLGAPGLYTDRHVKRWRHVVDAVHDQGGYVVAQIAHDGRQSHTSLSDGKAPIAPSVVPFDTEVFTTSGWVPNSAHRALDTEEIPSLIAMFRRGARLAAAAGFDGVELHAANGYLVDTFLQDGTNKRIDAYGGDLAGRARFPLEAAQAFIDVFGADRVGVRVSPSGTWGAISDSDPDATFSYFAGRLGDLGVAYLHVIEPRVRGTETLDEGRPPVAAASLRPHFRGALIAAGGFDATGARNIVGRGEADAVVFGRLFSSNPDLPARLQHGWPLTPYDRDAFWGGTEHHYSDYLPFDEQQSA
jgi:N-ethylmaleimide reductase